MNNGVAILSTGIAGDITLPHNLIINDWKVFVEPTGTIDIELWKSDYANYPPTAATLMGDTGVGIYSEGLKNSGVTDYWTTSTGAKDDIIRINIAGVTNATKLNLTLGYNFY
jgi:hypothetical protein